MQGSVDTLGSARHCHTLPVRRRVANPFVCLLRSRVHSRSLHQVQLHAHLFQIIWTCIVERPIIVQAKHYDSRQGRRCKRTVQVLATVAEVPTEVQQVSQDGYEVTQESLPNSRRRITVTAPSKLCQKAWNRMIKQARKEVKAPGFRDMKSVRPFVLRPPHADQFALTF